MRMLFLIIVTTWLLAAGITLANPLAYHSCDLIFQGSETHKNLEIELLGLIEKYKQNLDPIHRTLLQKNIESINSQLIHLNPNFSIKSLLSTAQESATHKEATLAPEKRSKRNTELIQTSESLVESLKDPEVQLVEDIAKRLGLPLTSFGPANYYRVIKPTYFAVMTSVPKYRFAIFGRKWHVFIRPKDPAHSDKLIELQNLNQGLNANALMSFSPDYKFITIKSGNTVRIIRFDINSQIVDYDKYLKEFKVSDDFTSMIIQDMEVSPDLKYLGFFTANQFYLQEIDTNKLTESPRFQSHGLIRFSPDGKLVAITEGLTAMIYSIQLGLDSPVYEHKQKLKFVYNNIISWSPDGKLVAFINSGPNIPFSGVVLDLQSSYVHEIQSQPQSENLRHSSIQAKWDEQSQKLAIAASGTGYSMISTLNADLLEQAHFSIPEFYFKRIVQVTEHEISVEGSNSLQSSDIYRRGLQLQ